MAVKASWQSCCRCFGKLEFPSITQMNVQIMTGAAHPTHGNAGIDRLFKPNGIYDTSLKFLFPFDIAN